MPIEASILALGVATSGMDFGGLNELMAKPEKLVSGLAGWVWGGAGKFFEPRERPQPIVYGLSRNVLRLWMRRLKNLTCVFLWKNEGVTRIATGSRSVGMWCGKAIAGRLWRLIPRVGSNW